MAAVIARAVSKPTFSIPKRFLSSFSSVAQSPPLPGFILSMRCSLLSLVVQVNAPGAVRLNEVRCMLQLRRYCGDLVCLPSNSGSNSSGRPPNEMAPLFYSVLNNHWVVVMDNPGGKGATEKQIIDCYIRTLAEVVGSEEEAKKKIYHVWCNSIFLFSCEIDMETSNKLKGLPGVQCVLPDCLVDVIEGFGRSKLFVNGEMVKRLPERQRMETPQKAQDKPKSLFEEIRKRRQKAQGRRGYNNTCGFKELQKLNGGECEIEDPEPRYLFKDLRNQCGIEMVPQSAQDRLKSLREKLRKWVQGAHDDAQDPNTKTGHR
ncbi:hypothetical protein BVC80_1383g13 [Macleaya cordata]|uniref:MORF/ORRM1/DAG-like MORF domain-containing protein n=1 Tax=Macleaya cordata TaxID=56857 RepID=A0A200Q5U2_MACCD|nr:hypothetical protein BVC80_1383g13 [Macleaya cordata]